MYSDLERARQRCEQQKEVMRRLERSEPEQGKSRAQQEATLHTARLRGYIAMGRVIALQQSCHAHQACESAPTRNQQQG